MENLLEVATELGEVGIDAALEDGVIRDIPILGSIVGIAKATRSVRDHFLLKKIGKFFRPIAEESQKAGEDLLAKLDADESFREKLKELIAFYLDKYDAEIKAEYLGIVLIATLNGDISQEEFFRIASLIERAFWGDLPKLDKYVTAGTKGVTQSLSACQMDGFVVNQPLMIGDVDDNDPTRFDENFEITPLGIRFHEIIQKYRTAKEE